MKMLLDENIPFRLYKDFAAEHEVYSAIYIGWNSLTNGELLKRMVSEGFEALITWDQNIQFQQNFNRYPITVFVFRTPTNDYNDLKDLIPKIHAAINQGVGPGPVEIY
jgi:hypothetical protein